MPLFRHDESPVEVERRRRGLDIEPEIRSTLEQQQQSSGRKRRQAEEEATSEESEDSQTELATDEQLRGRRQTTDPDQLCPTLASFVMPRAAVNNQGDWMFIVNMPDQVQFQQLVRSEVCM